MGWLSGRTQKSRQFSLAGDRRASPEGFYVLFWLEGGRGHWEAECGIQMTGSKDSIGNFSPKTTKNWILPVTWIAHSGNLLDNAQMMSFFLFLSYVPSLLLVFPGILSQINSLYFDSHQGLLLGKPKLRETFGDS